MLNPFKFGIAGGIVWGLTLFLITILSTYTGYAELFLHAIGSLYPGYSISLLGAFVGLFFGFIDFFIALYIIAWLYNKIG